MISAVVSDMKKEIGDVKFIRNGGGMLTAITKRMRIYTREFPERENTEEAWGETHGLCTLQQGLVSTVQYIVLWTMSRLRWPFYGVHRAISAYHFDIIQLKAISLDFKPTMEYNGMDLKPSVVRDIL